MFYPLVSQTEYLLAGKLREIHVSRLKFYDNSVLNVGEELKEYLKYQHASLYLEYKFNEVHRTGDYSRCRCLGLIPRVRTQLNHWESSTIIYHPI